jgi:maltose alpha-D-glucosyltransferase/alpha-amylase
LQSGLLPEYLSKQRWFGGKSRQVSMTRIVDWSAIPGSNSALTVVEVQYEGPEAELYLLLLGMTVGAGADKLRKTPTAVICPIVSRHGSGVLHDGAFDDAAWAALLALVEDARELRTRHGLIRGLPANAFQTVRSAAGEPLPVRRASAEHTNISVVYGERLILKLFRRLEPGRNPEAEIGQFLTETARFDGTPPFVGSIDYNPDNAEPGTIAILQGFVPNEGDGWKWTVDELQRYYENCAPIPFPGDAGIMPVDPLQLGEQELSQVARDRVGIYLESAGTLGCRTAEMHLALASPTDDSEFLPELLTADDLQSMLTSLRPEALKTLDVLKDRMASLPDEVVDPAALVLSRRRQILDHFRWLGGSGAIGQRIRIHGDYRLNELLRVRTDYIIVDFEGLASSRLAERRIKQCALKDVAGMLRSFSYAAYSTLLNYTTRRPEDLARLEPWAQLWERSTATEFLRAYRERTQGAAFLPAELSDFRHLLDAYLLDQALRELLYELTNRPAWVRIPLMCVQSLVP